MAHLSDANPESLEPILRAWWTAARPRIRTQDWETTWADLRDGWASVRHPIGPDATHEIIRAVAGADSRETPQYDRPEVRRLIEVCRALQTASEIRGTDWFYLSCRTAAVEAGFGGQGGPRVASRWLARLVADGVLELVRAGIPGARTRRASEYRFRGVAKPAA